VVLPLIDLLLLAACVLVANQIRLGYQPGGDGGRGGWISYVLFAACVLCGTAISGAYKKPIHLRRLNAAAEFIFGTAIATAAALFLIYVVFLGSDRLMQESRAVLLFSSLAFVPAALVVREVFYRIHARLARSRPYLLIGREDSLREFSSMYSGTGLANPVISMRIEDLPGTAGSASDGSPAFWKEVGLRFEAVILTEPPERFSPQLLEKLVRMHFCELPVLTLNAFYSLMWRQVPTLHLSPSWVFEQDFSLAERSHYRVIKRGFDILFSLVLLAALFPLALLVAALIKADSRGPVLFRQERVGRNRRVFSIFKFRTMTPGSESGAAYTASGDPRITRVGRVLRKLRLDEIPQLLNVLQGDMSLIGPRPEWVRLVPVYEKEIPFYHLRHLVQPGITGWAQLNFRYGESLKDTLEKLRFDLYYIRFYSPVLDLEIFLKTVLHVLAVRGK
jgi:exopolysaccharide biosynthesis polyprenyl glycosylphosphotransferase